VKAMAKEIISACDAYSSRKIGHEPLQTLIFHYANQFPDNCPDASGLAVRIRRNTQLVMLSYLKHTEELPI